MDCDTTGIEPDFALVKFKELVGGGQMTIVNRTVPLALTTLGYADHDVAQIEAHVNEHGTIIGAPGLKDEHLPVFDVAVGERAISHMGHIKMMSAVQPFISGAISKTVNMPEDSTVEEIREAYIEGGKLGLKALAIYRDGSKTAQSLPDYIMRWLASRFLDPSVHEELGIMSAEVRAQKMSEDASVSSEGNGGNGHANGHASGEPEGGSVAPTEALTDTPPVVPAK